MIRLPLFMTVVIRHVSFKKKNVVTYARTMVLQMKSLMITGNMMLSCIVWPIFS